MVKDNVQFVTIHNSRNEDIVMYDTFNLITFTYTDLSIMRTSICGYLI